MSFTITRRNELVHDGEIVGRFGSEAAAADTAIRFAQDAGALYSIRYGGTIARSPVRREPKTGITWRDKYRDLKLSLEVRRTAQCVCGMWCESGTGAHGWLFGPMCSREPKRGPWRYSITLRVGGTFVWAKTWPEDLRAELATLRSEAGRARRSTWVRYNGGEVVARWDR